MTVPTVSIPNIVDNKSKLSKYIPNGLLALVFVKACHVIFNGYKQYRFPGDRLLPCNVCMMLFHKGAMQTRFTHDLRIFSRVLEYSRIF